MGVCLYNNRNTELPLSSSSLFPPPQNVWVRGLCERTAGHFAGDTLFPSPFPHPLSESWDLGGFPAAWEVMASPPQPSLFLASLFLLPLIPFSQRPLEARPDVQPRLPQAAANTSHTLKAPAGANSWFSSCPRGLAYPSAKSSTKSCKEPPQDQLGKEAAPHLPDTAHPKTKSPFSSPKNKTPLPKTFPKGSYLAVTHRILMICYSTSTSSAVTRTGSSQNPVQHRDLRQVPPVPLKPCYPCTNNS